MLHLVLGKQIVQAKCKTQTDWSFWLCEIATVMVEEKRERWRGERTEEDMRDIETGASRLSDCGSHNFQQRLGFHLLMRCIHTFELTQTT